MSACSTAACSCYCSRLSSAHTHDCALLELELTHPPHPSLKNLPNPRSRWRRILGGLLLHFPLVVCRVRGERHVRVRLGGRVRVGVVQQLLRLGGGGGCELNGGRRQHACLENRVDIVPPGASCLNPAALPSTRCLPACLHHSCLHHPSPTNYLDAHQQLFHSDGRPPCLVLQPGLQWAGLGRRS